MKKNIYEKKQKIKNKTFEKNFFYRKKELQKKIIDDNRFNQISGT